MSGFLSEIGLSSTQIKSFVCKTPVDKITANVFKANKNIESIVILSAKEIEDGTFEGCQNLKYLQLPGIKEYTSKIFGEDKPRNLQTIKIGDGTKNIHDLFNGLESLSAIDFPTSLKTIEGYSLSGCKSLNTLFLDGRFDINNHAFEGADNLSTVFFPIQSFITTYGLQSISSLQNVAVLKNNPGQMYSIGSENFSNIRAKEIAFENYGDFIQYLPPKAFSKCENLQYLNLQNSQIDCIEENTFYGCYQLSNLVLPSRIKTLKSYALDGFKKEDFSFPKLTQIDGYQGRKIKFLASIDDIQYIGPSSFYLTEFQNQEVCFSKLESIQDGAFRESNIKEVVFSKQISSVPSMCFYKCKQLTNISGTNIKNIESLAFAKSSVRNIDFDNIETVGVSAFSESEIEGQKFLDISNVKEISEYAFSKCNNIRRAKLKNCISKDLGKNIFRECKNLLVVDISDFSNKELNDILEEATGNILVDTSDTNKYTLSFEEAWKKLAAFFGLENTDVQFILKDITLTKELSRNDWECLVYNDQARNCLIGIDLNVSDTKAFQEKYVLPRSTLSVLSSELMQFNRIDDTKTKDLSIDFSDTTDIGDGAFLQSKNIKSVVGNQITSFGQQSFASCYNLEQIGISDKSNTKIIADDAFNFCSSLNISKFPSTLQQIGKKSFLGCDSLKSLNFEKCLELSSIGELAFSSCNKLKQVKLPSCSNFNELQSNIFSKCEKLKKITIQSNTISVLHVSSLNGIAQNATIELLGDAEKYDAILSVNNSELTGNNDIKSPVGTMFCIESSKYKYPKYLTNSISSIVKINHDGFVTQLNSKNSNVELVGLAKNYNESDASRSDYLTRQNFKNIDSILNTAFVGSGVAIVELPKELVNNIQENTFSDKCESLERIEIDDSYSDDYEGIWESFGQNKNLTISFDNGYLAGSNTFTATADVFKYTLEPGVNTIYDVYEENVPANGNVTIDDKHKVISAMTFFNDSKIKTLNTNQISSIQNKAFFDNTSITAVYLTNNIQKLGLSAFDNSAIKRINIPGSIKTANGYGLNRQHDLQQIIYDEGITAISPSAMIDCFGPISSITFPASLKYLGKYAFAETKAQFPRIEKINLANAVGLSTIEKGTFYNSIKTYENNTLVLPPNVSAIYDVAFAYDPLTYTQSIETLGLSPTKLLASNIKYIGLSSFSYNCFRDISLSGTKLQTIDNYAFAFPRYQYFIDRIPNTIQKIGFNAFKGNKILNPQNIKKNIFLFDKKINDLSDILDVKIEFDFSADNKGGFTDFTVLSGNSSNYYNGFSIIYDDRMNFCPPNLSIDIINRRLIRCSEDSTSALVQSYLTSIGELAFYNCHKLTSIVADEGLEILQSAFYNCDNLEFFNDPNSIYKINYASDYEFYNCKKLSNVRLLSTAHSIGKYAFYNNDAVEDFQIQADSYKYYALSSIGDHAFDNCDKLSAFNFGRDLSVLGNNVFDRCPNLQTIGFKSITSKDFIDRFAYGLEVSSAIISKFGNVRTDNKCRIVFSDCVYTNDGYPVIDNDEFTRLRIIEEDNSNLSAISALNYQTFINSKQDYLNLCSIYQVDPFVFCDVQKLESISFLENQTTRAKLTHIGDFSFSGCTSLYNFNNSKVFCKSIGKYAFANDRYLSSLMIDANLIESIGHGAFYGTSLYDLKFVNCDLTISSVQEYEYKLKDVIGFVPTGDNKDRNPLQLPEKCVIQFYDTNDSMCGKYDYLFNNLSGANVDINRNQIIYVDKQRQSVKPLLLVKQVDEDSLPALALNSFHVNIVGRWK